MTTTSRTPEVWDLADDTVHPAHTVHHEIVGPDWGGPLAAGAGLLALGSACIPGVPTVARWCLVIGLGVVAVLVGFTALRRRQILLTVLLAVAGLVTPVLAAGVVVLTPPSTAPVQNALLAAGSPWMTSAIVRTSPALSRRPITDRTAAQDAATRLALHLRAMHGSSGPFPLTLSSDADAVVERGGAIEGVRVGAIPDGMHVRYSVAPDQRYFEIRVELNDQRGASATADSTIDLPSVD